MYPADRIPGIWGKPAAFVFNTQKHNKRGLHWVAVYVSKNGNTYYFDSLGKPPDTVDHINSIQRNCKTLRSNRFQLQSNYSVVYGHFCIMFLFYMACGLGFHRFFENFSDDLVKNDSIARNFVRRICNMS